MRTKRTARRFYNIGRVYAMTNIQKLIAIAKSKSGENIKPCGFNETIEDGITVTDLGITLWYNDETGSTHIVAIGGQA